jgi:hypothetical protein
MDARRGGVTDPMGDLLQMLPTAQPTPHSITWRNNVPISDVSVRERLLRMQTLRACDGQQNSSAQQLSMQLVPKTRGYSP